MASNRWSSVISGGRLRGDALDRSAIAGCVDARYPRLAKFRNTYQYLLNLVLKYFDGLVVSNTIVGDLH